MAGIDSNTALMLHGNGEDGSTSIIDSSLSPKTVSVFDNAQIDEDESKFGGSSILFDGNGDYLTVPYNSKFNILDSLTSSKTVDFWVKHASPSGFESYLTYSVNENNYWYLLHRQGGYGFLFYARLNGNAIITPVTYCCEITDTLWHHVSICKVGASIGLYVDGNQVIILTLTATQSISGTLAIGKGLAADRYLNGHLDEIRIQGSNYFNAAPNVGLTDTISVPTEEYVALPAHGFSQGIIII